MASAAAVSANEDRSPLGNTLGQDEGLPGEITSGIYSKDEELPGPNGEQESDEDLPSNPLSRGGRRRPAEDDDDDQAVDGDLFGDADDGEKQWVVHAYAGREDGDWCMRRPRLLDDEELDSGDDMERTDRVQDEPEREAPEEAKVVMDLELPRQAVPEPSDGEVCAQHFDRTA
jgi:RNA polymerase-associated protein LEO1